MKYAVFKLEDIERYTPQTGFGAIGYVGNEIERGRRKDGRKITNEYIVINRDEPYANEVIEIMKRHGHWNEDTQEDGRT